MTRAGWIHGGVIARYAHIMIDGEAIRQRRDAVGSKLDERGRRLFAAGEVRAGGRGGLAAVSSITVWRAARSSAG